MITAGDYSVSQAPREVPMRQEPRKCMHNGDALHAWRTVHERWLQNHERGSMLSWYACEGETP